MKHAKEPYKMIREIYKVIGRCLPDESRFMLHGITLTINGDEIELVERGMPLEDLKNDVDAQ